MYYAGDPESSGSPEGTYVAAYGVFVNQVQQTLSAASQMLAFAEQGADDFRAAGSRRLSGLYNGVTSGRSVTFVLQKLRGPLGEEFDAWYTPIVEELKSDPVAKWFVELRNKIEKEGSHGNAASNLYIGSFNTSEVTPPPGATAMFLGDHLGRSGWEIGLPDGTITQVFFNIPNSQLAMFIEGAPGGEPVELLLERWLASLRDIVRRAHEAFGDRAT